MLTEPTKSVDVVWTFDTGENVYCSPCINNGIVYFGSVNGDFYAVDADRGDVVWSVQVGSAVRSSPAVADGWSISEATTAACTPSILEPGKRSGSSQRVVASSHRRL